jgi:hypothetical protein
MMATGYEFGEPMQGASGIRSVRWRLLLAHDASSTTCDSLALVVESALGSVDITDASSVDDARVALFSVDFHVALVCLDLPPAPVGGVRLAQEVLALDVPVVLITRSLRWIPQSAAALRELPWVAPDAGTTEVGQAIVEALARFPSVDMGARSSSIPALPMALVR